MPNVSGIETITQRSGATNVALGRAVLDEVRTEDVGVALNQEGIAVRSGHHCAQPILRRMEWKSSVRPSLAFYNTC